jgi:hypothetical protein
MFDRLQRVPQTGAGVALLRRGRAATVGSARRCLTLLDAVAGVVSVSHAVQCPQRPLRWRLWRASRRAAACSFARWITVVRSVLAGKLELFEYP